MIEATLGQTVYGLLLVNPPLTSNQHMMSQNKELYNMLIAALMKGSAMHLMNGITGHNEHMAWASIEIWYGSIFTSHTIINHHQLKLEGLRLDNKTDISTYVNDFIICTQKLEDCNKGYTLE